MVLVLLSAHVLRLSVSHMQNFMYIYGVRKVPDGSVKKVSDGARKVLFLGLECTLQVTTKVTIYEALQDTVYI